MTNTHPHLEGLIRKWRDDAEDASKTAAKFPPGPVRQQGEWWAAARIRSAYELEAALALPDDLEECRRHSCKRKAALAALPGGGVDELAERLRESANRYYVNYCVDEADDEIGPNGRGLWTGCTAQQHDDARDLRDTLAAMNRRSPTPNPHEADRNDLS